jgi:hypothetical protein
MRAVEYRESATACDGNGIPMIELIIRADYDNPVPGP